MQQPKQLKPNSGQMLIELLFALAVTVMALVALVSAAITSIKNAQFAKNMVLANQYAQEGIEKARERRDRNSWNDFINWTPTNETLDEIFERSTNLTKEADRVIVTVVVSWTNGGKTYNSQAVTILSKWVK